MRLVYLSDSEIPSRASNSMQTMRMCDAFASAGAHVVLVHPRCRAEVPEGFTGDVDTFYGVRERFGRQVLPRVRTEWLPATAGRLVRMVPFGAVLLARGPSWACAVRCVQSVRRCGVDRCSDAAGLGVARRV